MNIKMFNRTLIINKIFYFACKKMHWIDVLDWFKIIFIAKKIYINIDHVLII